MAKDVLTTGDVARTCGVTIRTVIKWFEEGRLEGYKLPGSRDRRFTRLALERFLRANDMPMELLGRDANGAPRVLVADDDSAVLKLIERSLAELGTAGGHHLRLGGRPAHRRLAAGRAAAGLPPRRHHGRGRGRRRAASTPVPARGHRHVRLPRTRDGARAGRGADAFLKKPFELGELRHRVASPAAGGLT
jgi:excisionase family DNA binding protein